jgi:hypothetical protein
MRKKFLKTADWPVAVALNVFELMNLGNVSVRKDEYGNYVIIAYKAPNKLRYPNGWYYAKGCFRNKHNTTKGNYHEVIMLLPNGYCWGDFTT